MARPLRVNVPDGVYHVMSRGIERRKIVSDDRDRDKWVSLLDEVARRRCWRVFAWALLDNHFHLFLQTPAGDLSEGMHDLNSGYVTAFNARQRRAGPLLQGRFKGILVEKEYHDWELTRYIHLNPVRAGRVERPEAYAWSSCRHYVRDGQAPPWLCWQEVLGQHGKTLRTARAAYRRYLQEGIESPPPSPLRDAVASTLLGSPSFVEQMSAWLQERLPDRDVPAARELRQELSLEQIANAVCAEFGVDWDSLSRRGKHDNPAREVAVYLCRTLTRCPVGEIGERLGGVRASAVSNIVRKVRVKTESDRRTREMIEHIEARLGLRKNEK